MSDHTLQDLLARMQGRSITLGWGAILCFGRSRLNALLEGQFVDRQASFQQMPAISGSVCLNQDCTETGTLTNIRLGQPQLSFETASITGSRLTLSLPLISGNFSVTSQHVGMTPQLSLSVDVTESQGFRLSMDIALAQSAGEVDQSGRITLDLAAGENERCNLLGPAPAQKILGGLLMQQVRFQPQNRRVFELGLFDLSSRHPLSPVSFHLATQKAPLASDGDGGVLVFVRLNGNHGNGSLPSEDGDFPYLIPSDRQGQDPRWSASLVVAEDLLEWVDEERLDVLKNLLFPGRSIFVERAGDRHEPHDLLVLGNIQGGPGAAALEPLLGSIKAGRTQQFVARRADGSLINNVTWSTRSLGSPLSVGSITANGLYTAPDAATLALDGTPALVLGEYVDAGQTRQVAASVLGRFDGMSIHPRVTVRGRDGDPLELKASSLNGAALSWGLLEPAVGSLQITGADSARYTPPATLDEPFVLQRIECRAAGGDRIEAAVVLMRGIATAEVEPFFVPTIDFSAPLRFYNTSPPTWIRWSVQGGGSIDSTGVFTPPANPGGSPVSLVCCEIALNGNGPVIASGFAVVRLAAREIPPPRWRDLNRFTISAPGGLVQAYANGQQQIPVTIEIETKTVTIDGQEVYIKLSEAELASLRLVDKSSGTELSFVPAHQEGIGQGDGTQWAVNEKRNRFFLYSPTLAGENDQRPVPQPSSAGTSFRELFVHTTVQGSRTFFARFTGDDNRVYDSNEKVVENHEIELTGVRPPLVDPIVGPGRDFDMIRDRVYSGEGHGGPDGSDDFTYYLDSVDYWRINYRRIGMYPVPFATLRIERSASTIRWESEQLDETFFSYTGYAFHPFQADFSGIDLRPTELSFDVYFLGLQRKVPSSPPRQLLEPGKGPARGEMLVSLHRVPDMTYWFDGMAGGNPHWMFRALLDGPVVFVLMDMEGNRHRLQVAFQPPSIDDSRNQLVLSIQ